MRTFSLMFAAYVVGVATPIIIRFLHGYIAGAIWQWRYLRRKSRH